MTVVPNDELVQLICDGCGDTVAGAAPVLADTEIVWTLLSEHGWTGSPFATGPHRCPRCDLGPLAGNRAPHREAGRDDHGERAGTALRVDDLDGVAVVTVTGDIDVAAGEALHTALATAITGGGPVLVDLTRVHLIDSTGLGLLVRAHRQAKERGTRLCLAAPSRFILTVLHTMRLDGVFPIFDSRQDAVRALSPVGTRAARRSASVAAPVRPSDRLTRIRL